MGVWDSILPGCGRRFIKRKDSDAGEAGRALEELRGSLYNDFHTSEGAKRQQQRFCGPIVALTFNFVVAVGIIMANKMVMGTVGFNFPVALSLIHYLFAWALMAVLKALYLLPIAPPSKCTPFSSLFALGAVMSFSTGLANISLKHNSVGFYQMAKIAVTPTIVVAEFILFQKRVSLRKVIMLVVVSFGVAVATVTDLEFNFFGACVALAWIIPSAVNKILWSNLQQSGNWTALALMWKTTPITIFFFIVLMPLLDPPGLLSFKWDFRNSSAIIISALFGFLLQWSGALALGATSALAHVVLGQFKTIIIMLSGYLVFNSDPGLTSLCGAVIALAGMSVYTYLGIKESATSGRRNSLNSRQSSHLLKSKVITDGEKQETRTVDSV
ncbi:putative membrane protein [Panicum miliaceum]|uniref:Membrane protein n=1 Tax=Panicum miliaceum TaxID=4540 RepID=A0A3L6S1D8_PANMI|nr:putative membrane protein [Panicum miliaceum]